VFWLKVEIVGFSGPKSASVDPPRASRSVGRGGLVLAVPCMFARLLFSLAARVFPRGCTLVPLHSIYRALPRL